MVKFLQFIDAADDAATYPSDKLISMTCAATGTVIMKFSPGSLGTGQGASLDLATLTITADTEQAVMTAIAEAISLSRDSVIIVCDDVTSTFLHSDILSCTITLDA